MSRYSIYSLARHALRRHRDWSPAWRNTEPKLSYDIVIIGGGGHGLATAYYLARNHGITNVAVLEKGWIGGGNTARNTAIVRSNYLLRPNARFYEFSLKIWEGLAQELNYNLMFSPRGVLNLAHSDGQMEVVTRRGNALCVNGIDAAVLDRNQVRDMVPELDCSENARYPIRGGLLQRRGGIARHDAVAWGFARAADGLGVDIVQNCEVVGIKCERGRVIGVETTRGDIRADKVGITVAGHTGQLCQMAGFEVPVESHVLQAMVTEPLKPVLDTVVTSGAVHSYVSQSDKGDFVIGGDMDGFNSFAQRGGFNVVEHTAAAMVSLMPFLSRMRLMRTWGGVVDQSFDGSPIMGHTPIENLFLNGGWCYGGFKATPGSGWCFAHTLTHGEPHELIEPFALDRFRRGATLDEEGSGPYAKAH